MNVYMDNNATTRIRPEVLQAMLPYLKEEYGNPSSAYDIGTRASQAVYKAREQLANLINAKPYEIMFTASGTESDNTAVIGALALSPGKRHIVISAVEHPAVYNLAKDLEKRNYSTTIVPVNDNGELDLLELENAIKPDTALISTMYVNNETGVIFPLDEIGSVARKHEVFFHTDAVQAPGKVEIDVNKLQVDFLSLSGHKFHAPKGIGILYVKQGIELPALIIGGSQERGMRGGTENVAYIVGLGEASVLTKKEFQVQKDKIEDLRNYLENALMENFPTICEVNARKALRSINTSNILFKNIDGEKLLLLLNEKNIYVSLGSACHTGNKKPSRVLKAMGLSDRDASASVRFSLSIYSNKTEIDYVISSLIDIVPKALIR